MGRVRKQPENRRGRRKTPQPKEAAPEVRAKTDSASERIDRELAKAALDKQLRGENPTERELRALRRVEKRQDEQRRWEHYRTMPKAHWCKMAGRQVKVVNEQASRYGFPIGSAIIDLEAFIPAFHDFVATHARIIAKAKRDALIAEGKAGEVDELAIMVGESTPALEKLREVKYRREKLLLERELGEWLPRHLVVEAWTTLAQSLRRSGEALQRRMGPEAQDIYDEAVSTALDASERKLGSIESAQHRNRKRGTDGSRDTAKKKRKTR